ncbi:hypothetical protein [uncultured Tateyamaria sp.]|uniref:hypothetical protein n=1 Tax=Tateyamaria sp. 1078 TaxID=3417464 RepID=UPI0026016325|nr:hypothetical protein [uncultured Tateyamaria sp.]
MDAPQQPFPGAQLNPMLTISMPAKAIVAPDGDTLKASDAVNYPVGDPPKPITLKPGHKLFRVYGGPAGEIGGYWSPNPPAPDMTVGEWRNINAVLPSWNDGAFVAQLTVNDGHSLPAWVGGIWSQAAKVNKKIVPGWFLKGGGTQYHCDTWASTFNAAVTITKIGDTPWTTGAAPTAPSPQQDVQFAATSGDLDPGKAEHAHVGHIVDLAHALRSTAHGLTSGSTEAAIMAHAANEVMDDANAIVAHLDSDQGLVAHAILGHLGLTRAIDLAPSWPGAAAAKAKLDSAVMSAARISGVSH